MAETHNYWTPARETMRRGELREHQEERVRRQVRHFGENARYYESLFDEAGIDPGDIEGIDDLQSHVPITRKDDIRSRLIEDAKRLGGLATSPDDIVQYFSSTGSTGESTFYGSDHDGLEGAKTALARAFTALGVTEGDLVYVGTMEHHIATVVMRHALRDIGARMVGSMVHRLEIDRLVHSLVNLEPDYLQTPQMYLPLIEDELENFGKDISDLSFLDGILTGAQVTTPSRAEWTEQTYDVDHYDLLSMGEIPQVFHQSWCTHGSDGARLGYHVNEDLLFPEIVDPETGEPVPMGERGEVVLTTLVGDAVGSIRWGTEDMAYFSTEPCECERSFRRLVPLGREKEEIVVGGTSVFPSEVEEVLWNRGLGQPPEFQVVKSAPEMETLRVEVLSDDSAVRERAEREIESALDVSAAVSALDETKVEKAAYKVPTLREE